MSTSATSPKSPGTTIAQPLGCGARRRPPLGAAPVATSHSDLRERLLGCAG